MYLVNYIHLENVKYLQKRLNAGSDEVFITIEQPKLIRNIRV